MLAAGSTYSMIKVSVERIISLVFSSSRRKPRALTLVEDLINAAMIQSTENSILIFAYYLNHLDRKVLFLI